MAELPDLEVFAQIISRKFKGKTLKELQVKVAKKLNVTAAELKDKLEGKKLSAVSRYGKTLHFHFGEAGPAGSSDASRGPRGLGKRG